MNVLYLTLEDFDSIVDYHGINTDLLRVFQKHGHNVYAISPSERRKGLPTRKITENNVVILKPRIGNIQKTGVIEKGFSTITVGRILVRAINRFFMDVKFDLILYCTPPITFLSTIKYLKKRDNAKTYLLLKDIFPQNAVDIGIIKKSGIKGILYRIFRRQEKMLYRFSDRIGCMSTANVKYVIRHNPEVNPNIVEVCPNTIDPVDYSVDSETRIAIRKKYRIPIDKRVLIYGGNLGKPQGIPYIIECVRTCRDIEDVLFVIVGDGTEYQLIKDYIKKERASNLRLLRRLPKEDYDTLVGACDVGLIFLDHRFTIPNFPSRLLSYMQAKIPVLAATDSSTDIGKVIKKGGFGWWCESDCTESFREIVKNMPSDVKVFGENGWEYLNNHYTSSIAYDIIMKENG